MKEALAALDRAAAANPGRVSNPWTADERELALYVSPNGAITLKSRLAILNATNKAAGRDPRSMRALENFISHANETEGNEP